MIFNFSFYIKIIALALVVNGSEKIKCDYCHSIDRVTKASISAVILAVVTLNCYIRPSSKSFLMAK